MQALLEGRLPKPLLAVQRCELMKIHVIIPVHNRREITRACIECLLKQSDAGFDVTVVDDGSSDGTAEMLAAYGSAVTVIRGDGNLWWTGGVNAGLRRVLPSASDGDAVLLLNDDLLFDADYVSNIRQAAVRSPGALIGSVIVKHEDQDTILTGGFTVNWWTARMRDPNAGTSLKSYPPGYRFDASVLSGQGVLIPVSVLKRIGLYRSDHYVHCGDFELPRRAVKAGYKVLVDYSCVIVDARDKDNFAKRDAYRLSDLRRFFFDIRSYAYWRYRFWLAVDGSENIFAALSFLVCDFGRLMWRFGSRLRI